MALATLATPWLYAPVTDMELFIPQGVPTFVTN